MAPSRTVVPVAYSFVPEQSKMCGIWTTLGTVGADVGVADGWDVVGATVVGCDDGVRVGATVGSAVGVDVGTAIGDAVG